MPQSNARREAAKGNRSAAGRSKAPLAAAKPAHSSGGNRQTPHVAPGVMHEVPEDLQEVLTSDADLLARWNGLTPIQRNEWICWVTIVKKQATRAEHVRRLCSDLREGKRQPCCWPGCPHRRPKAKKWFRTRS